MPIRILGREIASKIAAGEVIERPASVVKELVENSLDADSTEVVVEINSGGMDSIRVSDNGSGIAENEMELAFHRFATSKVSGVDDLEAITTLGFRGEALTSIAAVAHVGLVTRSADASSGTRLETRNGVMGSKSPCAAAYGTTLLVKQLFDDFPARHKFLKTPAAESSRVEIVVSRFALAYPEVRMRLIADGKERLATSGSGRLREAFTEVYSTELAEQMLEIVPGVSLHDGPQCTGLLGAPTASRANRTHIIFFVNRRWVQSRVLTVALEQAYHGFLKERRHPISVVNVMLPPGQLDVNVHPAKSEVRFQEENVVFGAVKRTVREVLSASSPVSEMATSPIRQQSEVQSGEDLESFWSSNLPAPHADTEQRAAEQSFDSHHGSAGALQHPLGQTPRETLSVLRVLGQVQTTYIVTEGPRGMYLIDQHAAHERILFEKVVAQSRTRTVEGQALLESIVLDLDARRYELMKQHLDVLTTMGFQLEAFGSHAFMVRGVPGLMSDEDPKTGLIGVLDLMAEGGGFESWEERAAYSIACHSAIRAGKVLSLLEMQELIRQLQVCDQPNTCPHGRPTMVFLSSSRLEREFGRR